MDSFLQHLISIDRSSFVLILAVCATAALLLKAFLDRPLFVAVTALTFVPSTLLCRALMLDFGITPTYDMALNSMAACGAGMILGFSLTCTALVLVQALES